MGFGHRVYKNYDPRAKMVKAMCTKLLTRQHVTDPLFDTALELEDAALSDPYFVELRLYPNVDFYSGLIYRAIGIPTSMFTVMFAMGRMPGWIAHWKEMHETVPFKIGRPRQVYAGPPQRKYVAGARRRRERVGDRQLEGSGPTGRQTMACGIPLPITCSWVSSSWRLVVVDALAPKDVWHRLVRRLVLRRPPVPMLLFSVRRDGRSSPDTQALAWLRARVRRVLGRKPRANEAAAPPDAATCGT